MELEALQKNLDAKLKLLAYKQEKGKGIVDKANATTIGRHRDGLVCLAKEADEVKLKIEEKKIAKGEQMDEVCAWSNEIDKVIEGVDAEIEYLGKCLGEVKKKSQMAEKESEKATIAKEREEQLAFEKAQWEMKLDYEKKSEELGSKKGKGLSGDTGMHAKLPKLSITKFDGSFEQWLSFWNKFSAEIDATDLSAVTKFAYLKELLVTKVRADIDGLPFNLEGYERAKAILKSEYGKTSEIVNAYVNNIMGLPTITSASPKEINEFYKRLLFNVQSLETLGKLREVSGNVRAVLDKLKGIKGDLVRGHEDWRDWDFAKLIQAIKGWRDINSEGEESDGGSVSKRKNDRNDWNARVPPPRGRSYQVQQQANGGQMRGCVYCDDTNHTSANCTKVVAVGDRKRILSQKQLCFNCTSDKHRADSCRSRGCHNCQRRHHTSICDRPPSGHTTRGRFMTAQNKGTERVVYPVVVVEVNGIKCRALLDTGAGSSYASSAILEHLGNKPLREEFKRIEMMLGSTNKVIGVHSVTIGSLDGKFRLETEVTRVDRSTLLSLDNPGYAGILEKYPYLDGVYMDDRDEKPELPVHIILGASEYAKIKTETIPKIGRPGEPVAELTKFGWTIMSPGKEVDLSNMFLTQTTAADYEQLCKLDVLGLRDTPGGDQADVYEEFKEQLTRGPEGWYETGLPWRGNHPPLPNHRAGSLKRLESTIRKLEKNGILQKYDAIIKDQLNEGIVERVSGPPVGKEFYIPHKAVVREAAESTKLRIVYDASARASEKAPSLNECLHAGPPLQNKLWAVLVRARFHPVALTGDIKQAFLQVRIREEDRDAMRFHWITDLQSRRVETLRFTRALFGLAPSPFLLGGVIKQHLEACRTENPDLVREIEKSLYVDDLISGGPTVKAALEVKAGVTHVFNQASFKLHKWHSNVPAVESPGDPLSEDTTFAKEQLGAPQEGGGSILGLPWNKRQDTIEINFPTDRTQVTKRGILAKIARVYDPLGLAAPMTLSGKLLYRDACDLKVGWDAQLPGQLGTKWSRWEAQLPVSISVPRAIPQHFEEISNIELHCFGDASGQGVSAAVYGVISQPSGDSVGLIAAKARLAKQGLTIPRLELVSGHMATNLIVNVKEALEGFPVGNMVCWLDSSVALHWIKGAGSYKQFVSNRVQKIQQHPEVNWRHVGTKDNPADLGSRSGSVENEELWWRGPEWLLDRERWPADIKTTATPDSQAEAKVIRDVFAVAQAKTDILDALLIKFNLWKTLRVCAWVTRFIHNLRSEKTRRSKGPLTTEEIEMQRHLWLKRTQVKFKRDERFEDHRVQLNLQENADGLLECRGRIQGDYPIYLPESHPFAEKMVADAHIRTLHGGVSLTMAKIRERYWVPRLRRLAKRVVKACNGCKRFRATAFAVPPPGQLPRDRTEGENAFQVVGVDFAGPLKYRKGRNHEGKAYITLYACSLTRGIYLELLPSLETGEFLRCLKRFIARRGRPEKIYSDNGSTFVAAAKWLKQVMTDERLNEFLSRQEIKWQFNLSRAPWWGGQFERMVGLVKRSLQKTIGNGFLTWTELEEVILDVEVAVNNRPLSYVEDDVQLPILTPHSLLFGQPNALLELEPHCIEDGELRKRAKYLRRCKEAVWKRWTGEYLKGLRERHRLKNPGKPENPIVGEVVLIKSDDKNRGKWKVGIVTELIKGRDGVVRGAKLRTGTSHLERAVQQLYPLELSCDRPGDGDRPPTTELRIEAPAFRPSRDAAVAARLRMEDLAHDEEGG